MNGRIPSTASLQNQATGGDHTAQLLDENDQPVGDIIASAATTNDVIIDIPPDANQPAPPAQNNNRACTIVLKVAYLSIPVANAGMEAVQTAIGLQGKPPYLIYPATGFNFFAALGMNMKFTIGGIEKSVRIISQRRLPVKWGELPKGQEIAAATVSFSLASYAAFTDAVLSYFFVMELPVKYAFTNSINMGGWKALAIIGGGFTGVGIFSSEGIATYKKAREILRGVKPVYSNKFSAYFSPSVGGVLGTLNSLNDSIATFSGMKYVFDITSIPAMATIGTLSLANGITDYSINGLWVIEIMDDVFGSFTPAENELPCYKKPKVIVGAALSVAAGSVLAYAWRSLSKEVLDGAVEALGINYPSVTIPLIEVLACGAASSNFVNGSGSIYPLFYKLADKIGNTLNSIYNKMSCCKRNGLSEDMVEIEDGLLNPDYQEDSFFDDLDDEPKSLHSEDLQSDSENDEITSPRHYSSRLFAQALNSSSAPAILTQCEHTDDIHLSDDAAKDQNLTRASSCNNN